MTTGWAIKDAATGELLVPTVSPNRRGALVNWLYVVAGVPVSNTMNDGLIETIWQSHSARESRARAVMVRIEEIAS